MEEEPIELTTAAEDRALLKEFYGKSRFPNEPTGADMTYPESEDPEEDE
mgnify:CR=1 FL=1